MSSYACFTYLWQDENNHIWFVLLINLDWHTYLLMQLLKYVVFIQSRGEIFTNKETSHWLAEGCYLCPIFYLGPIQEVATSHLIGKIEMLKCEVAFRTTISLTTQVMHITYLITYYEWISV